MTDEEQKDLRRQLEILLSERSPEERDMVIEQYRRQVAAAREVVLSELDRMLKSAQALGRQLSATQAQSLGLYFPVDWYLDWLRRPADPERHPNCRCMPFPPEEEPC